MPATRFFVIFKLNMFWCVYDNKVDDVVGFWTDISAAEEFLEENQAEDDIWAIFPYDECVLSNIVS